MREQHWRNLWRPESMRRHRFFPGVWRQSLAFGRLGLVVLSPSFCSYRRRRFLSVILKTSPRCAAGAGVSTIARMRWTRRFGR